MRKDEEGSWEYRWASRTGYAGMPHPDELIYLGYEWISDHPIWPDSSLYGRRAPAPDRRPESPIQISGTGPSSTPLSKELANPGVRPDGGFIYSASPKGPGTICRPPFHEAGCTCPDGRFVDE